RAQLGARQLPLHPFLREGIHAAVLGGDGAFQALAERTLALAHRDLPWCIGSGTRPTALALPDCLRVKARPGEGLLSPGTGPGSPLLRLRRQAQIGLERFPALGEL